MTVAVVRTEWVGGPSSPGLTQFCLEDSGTGDYDAALAAVQLVWENLDPYLPNDYSWQVQPVIEFFSESTGVISGEYVSTPAPAAVPGGAAGAYAHGVGARIDWSTSGINGGRRVRGRTYLVPFAASVFDLDGTLTSGAIAAIGANATALINDLQAAGLPLVVWSRPTTAHPVGMITPVIAATIPDKAAVLRSRRD